MYNRLTTTGVQNSATPRLQAGQGAAAYIHSRVYSRVYSRLHSRVHSRVHKPANLQNIIGSEKWQHAYQGDTLHDGLFSAIWQSHGELGDSTLFTLWRCFRYALYKGQSRSNQKHGSMLTKVVRFMMDSSRPSGRVMVSWGKSISTSAISLPLSPQPT